MIISHYQQKNCVFAESAEVLCVQGLFVLRRYAGNPSLAEVRIQRHVVQYTIWQWLGPYRPPYISHPANTDNGYLPSLSFNLSYFCEAGT
jgi:hypothetical protein